MQRKGSYVLPVLLAAILLTSALSIPFYASAYGDNMTIAGIDLGYAPGDCCPDTEESMALTGSVQCMAFARYCQTMVYGVNDYNAPEKFRDIIGEKDPSECTVENLKKWFMGCAPATHLRCPGGKKSMHSMAFAETSEEGVHMIHGNWYPGNIVDETYWSWERFAGQVQDRGGIVFAMSYIGEAPETTAETPTQPDSQDDLIDRFLAGDADGNGKVTTRDARLALRYASKLEMLTSAQLAAADADKNGKVTAADARKILRAAARLETLS